MAVMAYETDLRIFVQLGAFTIHDLTNTIIDERLDAGQFLQQLVIPGEDVDRFAFEIDACGYTEGDISPNLDHLSSELRFLLE